MFRYRGKEGVLPVDTAGPGDRARKDLSGEEDAVFADSISFCYIKADLAEFTRKFNMMCA